MQWGAWGEVLVYALRRRRYLLLAQSLLAEGLYLGALRAMWLWRPVATLWVYLIPYAITSLALMLGNWCALEYLSSPISHSFKSL